MTGYASDYSKSNNAHRAEAEGRYPLTQAVKVVANTLKITQGQAREMVENFGHGGEYHHTGSWYNCTNYYDVTALLAAVEAGEIAVPIKKQAPKNQPMIKTGLVEWTEWSGSRNYPKATNYAKTGTITWVPGKTMATVAIDGQAPFTKKLANLKIDSRHAENVFTKG